MISRASPLSSSTTTVHPHIQTSVGPSSESPTTQIECILFNLSVIVEHHSRSIVQCETSFGLPELDLDRLLDESKYVNALERGEFDLKQFIHMLQAETAERGPKLDAQQLFDLLANPNVTIRSDMISAIQQLRNRGLIVGGVTNNWKTAASDKRGAGIHGLDYSFDFLVESCLVGCRAPESRLWDLALCECDSIMTRIYQHPPHELTGLPPSHCILLDESDVNLKSAEEFGMKTIKVTKVYRRAIKELEKLTSMKLLCGLQAKL